MAARKWRGWALLKRNGSLRQWDDSDPSPNLYGTRRMAVVFASDGDRPVRVRVEIEEVER